MHLELRHLRYFVAVAEELNFSRAAERLHVAQPALSAQIRALESQLGCELFARTTRKVELTPNGRLLLEDAYEILRRADGAVAKLQAAARGERGILRIGFAAHGAVEIGMEILRRFGEEDPAVETELVSASTLEGLQRAVVDHETDVAFAWLPLVFDELAATTIRKEPKLVAMHPEHPLAQGDVVRPEDLASEPIVGPWEYMPPGLLAAWFEPFRPNGRRDGDPTAMSVDESLAFASRGLALYCVPESASRFYPRPGVVFRPILDVPPAEVGVAWRAASASAAVASFVRTAQAVAESHGAIQSVER
jgi:DNA-binding transcriptional LysR family regulator